MPGLVASLPRIASGACIVTKRRNGRLLAPVPVVNDRVVYGIKFQYKRHAVVGRQTQTGTTTGHEQTHTHTRDRVVYT